ncbi:VOC family protein [Microlunatus ginsengisoli]|uniref:VOC family protein n=1 Tax=Microlunatus ginsengisoli TaxID=363863 RepID=A0ABP7A011_9ACTN
MSVIVDDQRRYPAGVPCWVDLEQREPARTTEFYGGLFGWQFREVMPPGAAGSYLVATLDGHDVAGATVGDGSAPGWNTYIACDDVDATAAAVTAAGGVVRLPPQDAGPGGRWAGCADPDGAVFRLWQARRRLGAQLVNTPGTWNFSDLLTPDPARAVGFYRRVFGWQLDAGLGAGMIRLPGYGDHLASTIDPHIFERQAAAPPGFADVVAGIATDPGPPRWHLRFTVADRDRSAEVAAAHGAEVLSSVDTMWTREALIVDPQGAVLTLSQFAPPGG